MHKWRRGYGERRRIFRGGGEWFTFVSNHPEEERIVILTDDYRDDEGNFIPPEILAPEPEEHRLSAGIVIVDPDDERP